MFRSAVLSDGVDPEAEDAAVEIHREIAEETITAELAKMRDKIAAVDPKAFPERRAQLVALDGCADRYGPAPG